MLYRATVWGWKRQKKIERVSLKYMKWVLGLDTSTINYIILDAKKSDKLWIKARKRALNY